VTFHFTLDAISSAVNLDDHTSKSQPWRYEAEMKRNGRVHSICFST
jgi:hypothetical protein